MYYSKLKTIILNIANNSVVVMYQYDTLMERHHSP